MERIDVDFGYLWRHGITRDLHLADRLDRLHLEGATDGGGRPLPLRIGRRRQMRARIGDPDSMVTGVQTYVLRYTIRGALDHHDDRTELYWGATGTESEVPIERATVSVTAPAAGAAGAWRARCFAGSPGSSDETRCSAAMPAAGRFRFATTVGLAPGEGLTIRAIFPPGVVARPSRLELLGSVLSTFGPLALPLAVLAALSLAWARSGRDPKAGSVVAQWRLPEGLPPGPAGALVDDRAEIREVVATLIDLARRGYVRIQRVVAVPLPRTAAWAPIDRALQDLGFRDWQLDLLTDDRKGLEIYERLLLDGIFGAGGSRRLVELRSRFHVYLPEIRRAIYRHLVARRLVREDPQGVRRRWVWFGFAVLLAGALSVVLGRDLLGVGVAGSGIVIMLFSKIMPATTPKGAALRRDLKGLEEYIRRAEKAEIELREAPPRTPERFSEILPYAIALGVTEEWTRQFAGDLTGPPDWLAAGMDGVAGLDGFDVEGLISGLEGAISKALESTPEIPLDVVVDGLGSVGGGGGGGGIGGW